MKSLMRDDSKVITKKPMLKGGVNSEYVAIIMSILTYTHLFLYPNDNNYIMFFGPSLMHYEK